MQHSIPVHVLSRWQVVVLSRDGRMVANVQAEIER